MSKIVTLANVTCKQRSATAVYVVVTSNEQGSKRDVVEVTVDFDELRDLARRAVDNANGEATLHYRAIIAKTKD